MFNKRSYFLNTLCLVAAVVLPGFTSAQSSSKMKIQVFILAGQSNMEGQGVVDFDHPEYYNGGKGTLLQLLNTPENADRFAHLRDSNGEWVRRNDVYCRFQTEQELKKGPLTIGFTGYSGKHHIGPELQFGHVIGDAVEAPVLLIKTAWGGKSLHSDFRPPRSEGNTGPFYSQMIREIRQALEQIGTEFPAWEDREFELAGFVWFQGWNDAFGPDEARKQYEQNLVNLIMDVRDEFATPDLPFVIGELGNDGAKASDAVKAIRRAQAAAADRQEWNGRVRFVETAECARAPQASPNVTHGHHWYGNAESYLLIGEALGNAMSELLTQTD